MSKNVRCALDIIWVYLLLGPDEAEHERGGLCAARGSIARKPLEATVPPLTPRLYSLLFLSAHVGRK